MQRKFLADAMLGSLTKWLRALGYDTCYQRNYGKEGLERLLSRDRLLLSRNRKTVGLHPGSVLIRSEHLSDQILEMRSVGLIHTTEEGWFTRCLICNVPLEKADPLDSRQNVPEYVFHETDDISRCPSCGRYFWPGTHRERMVKQLREWGFRNP